jgi:hypothetical protein
MVKDVEEYRAIRQHIQGQFTLIFQVFTASIVAAIALLGYALNNILGTFTNSQDISNLGLFLLFPLIPLAVIVPFAFLIKSLRKEIFKWGAYVEVYLEDGKDRKYETELSKYMTKYRERESFNPIALSYFVLSGLCFFFSIVLYFLYKFPLSFPNLFWLILIIIFAIFLGWFYKKWWDDYKDIPIRSRQEYILRWENTKNDTSENADLSNKGDTMFNRGSRAEVIELLSGIRREFSYQWWWSFGLSFIAIGMGALSISITWRTGTPVAFQWFWPGFFFFVVGAIIILIIGVYTVYSACKHFSIKKNKSRSNN